MRKNNEAWRRENLSEFQRQARLWEIQDKPAGLLFVGEPLARAESWIADQKYRPLEYEAEFLEECQAAEQAAAEDRRKRKLIRNLAVVATCLMVVALILAGAALSAKAQAEQRRVEAEVARADAERQAQLAKSRALVAASIAELDRDPELSVLLAEASDAITRTAEGEDAMRRALSQLRIKQRLTVPVLQTAGSGSTPANANRLTRAIYSPDGKRLAMAGPDKGVVIFELDQPASSPLRLSPPEDAGRVTDLAFSPDGSRLATAHDAGDEATGGQVALMWDARTGEVQRSLAGHSQGLDLGRVQPGRNTACDRQF